MPLPDPKEYQCRKDILWYFMQESVILRLDSIERSLTKYSKHELLVSLGNLVHDGIAETDPWAPEVYRLNTAVSAIRSLRFPGDRCPMCGNDPRGTN